jgi:sodium/potassium/calcium exchanger 5
MESLFEDNIMIQIPILLCGLGLTFTILASVCDRALEPCMEELSDRFKLPHDVACATFLALGSSAPEIFISCVATIRLRPEAVDISMGTIYGSALIAFTLIPAVCTYASPDRHLKLEIIPLLRDTIFYATGLSLLIWYSSDGEISIGESFSLVILFGVYLLSMLLLAPFYHHSNDVHHFVLPPPHSTLQQQQHHNNSHSTTNGTIMSVVDEEKIPLRKISSTSSSAQSYGTAYDEPPIIIQPEKQQQQPSSSSFNNKSPQLSTTSTNSNNNDEPHNMSTTLWIKFLQLFPPFGYKSEEEIKQHVGKILVSSILTIGILSEICIIITSRLAKRLGISHHALGVVLVAIGAQIPDTFASVAVSRQGEGPSSIANAVGSQVVDILIGIGLPFFVSSLFRGTPVPVAHSQSTIESASAVGIVVIAFLLLCGVGWKLKDFGLTMKQAGVLIVLYGIVLVRVIQKGVL